MWLSEDQRAKHHKDTCLKDIRLHLQIFMTTLNNEHSWEDLCIQLRSQQTCNYDNHSTITYVEEV